MRTNFVVLLTSLLVVAGAFAVPALAGPSPPPDDTIVDITGDPADGFHIHHYDGSVDYPPTYSEVRAECKEYDTQLARVKCRVQVRTNYQDLTDTQQALDYAHQSG